MISLEPLTHPRVEPVTVGEVRAYCNISHDRDDAILLSLIRSAREDIVRETHHAAGRQTWRVSAWSFHELARGRAQDAILLLPAPLRLVNSIVYRDLTGAMQTLPSDAYSVITEALPGYVVPTVGMSWPDVLVGPGAVQITLEAGYDAPHDMPPLLRQAVLMLVEQSYIERGGIWSGRPYALERVRAALDVSVYW